MSSQVAPFGVRLNKAFTDFDANKLRWLLIIDFLILVLFFGYLYTNKIDVLKTMEQTVPVVFSQPTPLFGVYGTESAPLRKPMAVLELDNKIYVSDSDNHRVQVFDSEGNPIQIIGKMGKGKGEFQFPYGLASDSQKQLYVADLTNGNISVLSSSGQFIKYLGNSIDIKQPAGLFIENDRVYVADVSLNKVSVFDLDGKKLSEIGSPGTELGQLRSPNAVALYKGKVYVSDTGNDRVQIFNQLGQYIGILDGTKTPGGKSNLLAPRGVAIDNRGTVYVVNNLLHSVNSYNQKGERIFTFGGMGNQESNLYLPNGIFVDGQGKVFVTDTVNQRVNVFQN